MYNPSQAQQILSKEKDLKIASQVADDLRVIKSNYFGIRYMPEDIRTDSPEGVVFYILNVCFFNAGNVSEGVVKNVVWGFRQSGIPGAIVWDGMKNLAAKGYIIWTDKAGTQILGDINENYWYKFTPKFTNTLAENTKESVNVPEYQLITNTWDNVR